MKKRINTIDGKILVQGGTDNELKSNEIRVNADKSLTERVNGEIVNVGGSGGAKIVPYTKDITFKDVSTEEFITLSINEDGYYNYSNVIPDLIIDTTITDAIVFIGEVNIIGYDNDVDPIKEINIITSYVDKSTNLSINAPSLHGVGVGSPIIKFKLMEIV
jgi:hypothetical protein